MNKNLLLLMVVCLGFLIKSQAQTLTTATGTHTIHTVYCEAITSEAGYNTLIENFNAKYPARITSFTFNLGDKTAIIGTDMEPEDLLQIYKAEGYVALYQRPEGRYGLMENDRIQPFAKED